MPLLVRDHMEQEPTNPLSPGTGSLHGAIAIESVGRSGGGDGGYTSHSSYAVRNYGRLAYNALCEEMTTMFCLGYCFRLFGPLLTSSSWGCVACGLWKSRVLPRRLLPQKRR